MPSKEREVFKNIYIKRLDKINELSKKIDCGDLKFMVNVSDLEIDFSEEKILQLYLIVLKNLKYR